jgi:hypothetical protein
MNKIEINSKLKSESIIDDSKNNIISNNMECIGLIEK